MMAIFNNKEGGGLKMLETVTFTGVDSTIDMLWAKEVQENWPFVEFGILMGSQTKPVGSLDPKFPSLRTIHQWAKNDIGLSLSLHLCGRWAGYVNTGKDNGLYRLCCDFDRVQVNATEYHIDNVTKFAAHLEGKAKVILQHRSGFRLARVYPNVEYLYDVSGGRGLNGIERWPTPYSLFRCGYAGGISPWNIETALDKIAQWPSFPIWIDMESKVRSGGFMDKGRVEAVCEYVQERHDILDETWLDLKP